MKFLKKLSISAVLGLLSHSAMAQLAPYQTALPTLNATEFAPGVVSTDAFEINTVLNQTGDEVIFSRCSDDFSKCVLMQSDFVDSKWQKAKVLPFSGDYTDADPYFTPDYSTLYYISKRPIDGSNKATANYNLWRVRRDGDSWGEPEYLPELSSPENDLYPSVTDDGRLFFPSRRNNSRFLYYTQITPTGFGELNKIPAEVYGENGAIGDSVVSRDGKVIIFSIRNRSDSFGRGDLYISRLVNNKWTVAENLGSKVNTPDHEFTPIFSPDNKKLYFTRIENNKGNLYEIDLSALNVSLEMIEPGQLSYRQQAFESLQNDTTLAGIPLDKPWKRSLYQLVANTMQHPAWGMNHYERNYLLTLKLAEMEGVKVDTDVLFAAAFLHDMATFQPWANGTDHSQRAAELVPLILEDIGFDTNKVKEVQDLILGHMFYSKTEDYPLAQLFHDADTLDFMGVTGITRILSLNGKGAWATNTAKAIETLKGFTEQLPPTLVSASAKRLGEARLAEMQHFLEQLEPATYQFKAP